MNFVIRHLPKSEIEISITIPFADLKRHLEAAAHLISEEITIEGFRKGKAPYELIKNKIGEMAIYERGAELAVSKTYPEALKELSDSGKLDADRPPIGRPEVTITKLAPQNDLSYKVKLALLPAVTLPDYASIAKTVRHGRQQVTVSDEEVEQAVRWVQDARATLVTVQRKAEHGDRVEVDFDIRQAGVKIENGASKNHPLIIGEGRFLPGFEDELAGLEAGEKKEFTLRVPEDWGDKRFAGKALQIAAEMKLVQKRQVPELTDEFVRGLGDFASPDALKASIRAGLTREKEEKETQRIRTLMIEEIARGAPMEIPDLLIASETQKMMDELKAGVEEMGMTWENYLLHIKKTPRDLEEGWKDEAAKRVRVALCLRHIARKEEIEPGSEEIRARANQFLSRYESPQDAAKKIDPIELQEYAKGILKNEKVFEFLETV